MARFNFSLRQLLIAITFIAISLSTLVWFARHWPDLFVYALVSSCSIGIFGLVIIFLAAVKLFSVYTWDDTDDRKRKRPAPKPPAPYRKRLAQFCECDESDVMLDRPKLSSMPFKTFTSIGPYIGPKPSKVIRYLLHHIRLLVGRHDSEQGNRTAEP